MTNALIPRLLPSRPGRPSQLLLADLLVYELYELTDEEIAVVEGP
jgi:hypothetical protein